jgi:DNA repair exonuclease SbcCD ATPase subunit
MKIERLRLKNFCQHQELDWSIPNGIVAISGPNGSGKSNAIKAIYSALTGDFRRNEGVMLDNISKTCSEKDDSFIELTFSNNGDVSTILRSLRPNKKSLSINGSKPITSDKEIKVAIEGLIGISPDILNDYIFVDQWKMFEVFTATKSDRLSALQSLYGLSKAELCYDEIGKSITKINIPIFSESISDVETGIRERKLLLDSLNTKLVGLMALKRDDSGLVTELAIVDKVIKNNTSIQVLIKGISDAEASIKVLNDNASKALQDLGIVFDASTGPNIDVLVAEYGSYSALIDVINNNISLVSEWKFYDDAIARKKIVESNIETAIKNLESLGEGPAKPSTYIEAVGANFNNYNSKLGSHEAKKACIKELLTNKQCPVCQSTGNSLDKAVSLLQSSVDEESKEIDLLKAAFADSRKFDKEYADYLSSKTKLDTVIAGLNASLSDINSKLTDPPSVSSDDCKAALDKAQSTKSKYDTASLIINELNKTINFERGRLDIFRRNKETIEKDITDTGLEASNEELISFKEELTNLINVVRSNNNEIIRTEEAIKGCSDTIEILETRRTKIAEGLMEAKTNMEVKNYLESLKELMHKSNLPKKVAFNYLKQTVAKMNSYLEDFNAPFRVYSDSELMFWAKFSDGRDLPAARLSGGEKVVLALAFRLAVQFGIASGVNLLVLDEPTVGLDDDNIECLEMAFNRLRAMSQSSGLQVLIVSHEKAIERMCDHTISLYR